MKTAFIISILFTYILAYPSGPHYTIRRPIRQILMEHTEFTEKMIEELLITNIDLPNLKKELPMNHLMYDDMQGLIDELGTDFKALVSVESIGKTYEGRDI